MTLRTFLAARSGNEAAASTLVAADRPGPDHFKLVRMVAPGVAILLIIFVALVANTSMVAPVFALGLVGLVFATTQRGAASRLWALYFLAILALTFFRSFADETGIPTQVAYAADWDRAMFGGVLPTTWLQEQLYAAGQTRLLDWAVIVVYVSFFLMPHIAGVFIWRLNRPLLGQYVAAIGALIGLGLIGHYLVPTAPPWMAAEEGVIGDVTRIVITAMSSSGSAVSEQANAAAATNAVAAMPSLHTAIAVLIAIVAWRGPKPVRIVGLMYPVAMAFALVYTGEHYVADTLVGAVVAFAAWRIAAWATPRIAARWPESTSDAAPTPSPPTAPPSTVAGAQSAASNSPNIHP